MRYSLIIVFCSLIVACASPPQNPPPWEVDASPNPEVNLSEYSKISAYEPVKIGAFQLMTKVPEAIWNTVKTPLLWGLTLTAKSINKAGTYQ